MQNFSNTTVQNRISICTKFQFIFPLFLFSTIGATESVLLGQDVNWDLRNYHIYNAYALLNGRLWVDLMPAGWQSNFNPLLDLPYYLLAIGPMANWPRLMAAAAGLPYGLLLFATFTLARWVLADPTGTDRMLPWFAAAMCGTAAATASEVGTTCNDLPVAALLVGGLAIGGRGCGSRLSPWRVAAAGGMVGGAVALKLTCALFVPAVLGGLLVATIGWRARCRVVVLFFLAAVPAALALAGPWGVMLASRYGNPVFPLMNGIFRSAWYPPRNYTDYRFVPADTAQALLYPFRWALSNAPVVSELSLRDARFALAMLMVPLLLACLVKSRVPGKRRALALLVASVLGYVLWLHAIAYLRYAITLEVFASVLFCVTLYHLARLLMPQVQGAASVFAAQLLMALFWHTQVVDWWRVPFGERVFAFDTTALPSGSLVLTVGQPVALALPFLDAPNYRAVGITQTTLDARGYRLYREAVDTIRHHDGPIYVVTDTLDDLNMLPTEAGVALEPAQCRKLPNNITVRETSILLCPAHLQE